MATVTRWDPFREMNALRSVMNQMMNDREWSERSWGEGREGGAYGLALDVSKDDDEYIAYTISKEVPA